MLKHNKKKNSLIVYEQLLTLATRLAHNKKVDEFNFVVDIIKEFFSPSTMIGKEKKILQSLTEAKLKTENEASLLIEESIKEYNCVEHKKLELEKVALINKINKEIGADLFKFPISNYKLYASAQIIMNECSNGYKNSTPQERATIKSLLKENISKPIEQKDDFEIDKVTYRILINKFNQKYGDHINENQADILKIWLKSLITEDFTEIKQELSNKISIIKENVSKALRDKKTKSSEYYELLVEAKQDLSTFNKDSEINEDFVYRIMRYCDVVEDLKDGNK